MLTKINLINIRGKNKYVEIYLSLLIYINLNYLNNNLNYYLII